MYGNVMKGILEKLQGGETLEMISSTYPRTVRVSSKYFVLPSWQFWHYMYQSIFQAMEKNFQQQKNYVEWDSIWYPLVCETITLPTELLKNCSIVTNFMPYTYSG